MLPQRKDPLPNQDKNTSGLKKDRCLTPHVPPFPSGFISLSNKAYDDNSETTDTSRTDKDDTLHTNRNVSIEYLKATKNINDDEE